MGRFIVVSDAGHQAIASGWKLSNAYNIKQFAGGGRWHNVDYLKEVVDAEYEHLAIVPNPRYEESIILTPDQFKDYNSKKELELKRLANSKEEKPMFKNFIEKLKKIVNDAEVEVKECNPKKNDEEVKPEEKKNDEPLPTEKKPEEKKQDDAAQPEEKKVEVEIPYTNGDHKVKVGEEEMTVNELVQKHLEMKKQQMPPAVEEKPKNDEAVKPEEKKQDKEIEIEKKKNSSHFESLKNAPATVTEEAQIDLSEDKVQRGKTRYGSN